MRRLAMVIGVLAMLATVVGCPENDVEKPDGWWLPGADAATNLDAGQVDGSLPADAEWGADALP